MNKFPQKKFEKKTDRKNWTKNMKLSTYFGLFLILSIVLVYLVSAEEVYDLGTPGQQTPPNIANTSSPVVQPNNQPGQQTGGKDGMQNTPTPTQNTPGVIPISSQPSVTGGPEVTREPISKQTQEPQKTSSEVLNQDINKNKPVSPTIQPTQKQNEPVQTPSDSSPYGSPGQYKNIQFPHSYPIYKPDNAAIQVTSSPVGATVYLDGSYKGTTPSSGYLEISDLIPGTYTLHLTSSGYTDYSNDITVSKNQVATVSVDLTEENVPSNYGALSIQSTPIGSNVYLDNEYKGITPLTLQEVAIGSHSVLINKEGYSEYNGDVNIVSDQASGLSVTLTEIVTAVPTTVPAQPPAPLPTESPLSPWVAFCALVLVGLCFSVIRSQK